MARSVKWPLQKTARGGLALTSETDQGREELLQTVALAHIPGPSPSPWGMRDDVGAPESAFGIEGRDGQAVAPAILHSQRFFARMQRAGRARLSGGPTLVRRPGTADGSIYVEIEFEDLETGQPARVAAVPPRR